MKIVDRNKNNTVQQLIFDHETLEMLALDEKKIKQYLKLSFRMLVDR